VVWGYADNQPNITRSCNKLRSADTIASYVRD
jgi:hypothetical protein